MKKVYLSLLILFIVLLFVSQVIFAEPNTNLNILLYSEDKEDTATHFKLYASDEITPNKNIIYSIVITASVPSPLGSGNVIDQGLIALVVPETAEVDYKNIKVYGAPTPDSNKYIEYQPEDKSTKELFDILGLIISKIPALGLVMDLSPIYQTRTGDYEGFIDLNQYDVVKVNWETPRLKYWQKVQIDIPVHLGDNTEIDLYTYWRSESSSSDGTGPIFKKNNISIVNNIGLGKRKLEEVSKTYKREYKKIKDKKIYIIKNSYGDQVKNSLRSKLLDVPYKLYYLSDAVNINFPNNSVIFTNIFKHDQDVINLLGLLGKKLEYFVKNGGVVIIYNAKKFEKQYLVPKEIPTDNWEFCGLPNPSNGYYINETGHPIFRYLKYGTDIIKNEIMMNIKSCYHYSYIKGIDDDFITLFYKNRSNASIVEIPFGKGLYMIIQIPICEYTYEIEDKLFKGIVNYALSW